MYVTKKLKTIYILHEKKLTYAVGYVTHAGNMIVLDVRLMNLHETKGDS